MGRGKENEGETQKLLLSSVVLREDIVNLLDFIERLKNEEDQIVLDTDQIENLKLELTFLSACLQLCYYNSDGSKAKMSCISYEIHDLVQSLFHQSGDDMLVKLKDHVVLCLLENIKTSITSDHHSESSATMTEDQLVELLDALLVNLHYLPKVRAELLWPSMTQYELLQNVFGNLRDFHGLKVNGCIEHDAIEYVLPQIQLMTDEKDEDETVEEDEEDEDETDEEDKDETDEEDEDEDETDEEDEDETAEEDEDETDEKDEDQVNSMLVRLLLKIIPVSLEVMQICSTMLEASKSAELGCFIKKLLEASPDILREHLIHLQQHMVNAIPCSTSASSIHVMIEFLLLFLTDMPQDFIHYEKLFVLLARVGVLIREVSILIRNLEENSTDEENMNKISCASRDLLENIELLKEDLKNVFLKVPADSSQLCFPMSDGPLFMTLLLRNLNDLLNSNAYSVALIKDEIGWVKEDLEHIRLFFGNVEQELHRDLWTSILDVAYKAEHAINSILARDHGLLQLIFLLPDAIEKIKLVKKEVQEKISKNTSIIFVDSPNKPVINKSSIAGKIIVGFEEETEWIIRKLTTGPAEVDVISIVGMPGLGKTTLAYKVYNEKSVVGHFDILAWCTVDQERNEKKLLQKIFNQVMGLKERFNEDDIDDVADKLRKELFGKRYLVVLDDMWDTATWDELTRPFDPLDLRLLRPEESWALLEKRVFGEESCPDELRDVGEKISQKCDGLPLVLDLISGVMSRKEKKEVLWLEILNNLSSFIFKDEEEVMKVTQLSYDHLSDHLKPCFLYLASYPKDEDIEISQLKDLWSREGLVEQTDLKSVEEVTEVFVDELIASSLVIVRGRRKQRCQIHDLVHDFCSIKARTEKLFDLTSSIVLSSSSSSDLRQSSRTLIIDEDPHSNDEYLHSGYTSSLFNPEKRNPYVKHLLSLQLECTYLPPICHLRHLRLLKRLELLGMILRDTFLNEIGMLVHLRCLRILIQAEALPPSFSNLCNLETLVVVNFGTDLVLSPTIWSLAKLRHVEINSTCSVFNSYIDKPTELENLTILERLKLSCLVDSENIFKRFPNLRTLGFQLHCSVADQIYFPRLDVLNKLEMVCASFECCRDTHVHQFDFHFPSSLKEVEMDGFNLTSDALSGIGRSLPNLQKLELVGTSIQGGKEWNMEQVTFHNLKSLKLFNVSFSEWQVTADESFPVLEELEIRFCIELVEIPQSFGDIASLKSISLERSPQLKESALNIKKYVKKLMVKTSLK
ncbi:putative late blight resistance protein R1A-3 isoform X2 [Capsicum annuum]